MPPTDDARGLNLGLTAALAAAVVLSGLTLPFWLDNTLLSFVTPEQRTAYFGPPGQTVPMWLSILSWLANIVVALVAWHAVRFAKTQALEARRQAHEAVQCSAVELR